MQRSQNVGTGKVVLPGLSLFPYYEMMYRTYYNPINTTIDNSDRVTVKSGYLARMKGGPFRVPSVQDTPMPAEAVGNVRRGRIPGLLSTVPFDYWEDNADFQQRVKGNGLFIGASPDLQGVDSSSW